MSSKGKFDGEIQTGRQADKELIGNEVSYIVLSQKLSFMIRPLSFSEIHSPRAGNLRVPEMYAELH